MDERMFPGKQFISTVLDVLETKSDMTSSIWKVYLMRAAMAGMIIGLFYVAYHGVEATFDEFTVGDVSLLKLGKILGALVFGFALVFIYYTKSELLTSNMMITSIGLYYKKTTPKRVFRILGLCYLGNFLGGLFLALMLSASTLYNSATGELMQETAETKLAYIADGPAGWWDLFVRAILCNFLINLAMLLCYNGIIHDDIAKITTMVVAVFLFAYLGLEHSVANTVVFTIVGLGSGIELVPAVANVGIALVGNFIGGGVLIGLYYAYANDTRSWERRGLMKPHYDPEHGKGA